jgi:hypothetical protein
VSSFDGFQLLPCNISSWCCCGYNDGNLCDITACCSNSFTLAGGPGSVVRVLGSGASTTSGQVTEAPLPPITTGTSSITTASSCSTASPQQNDQSATTAAIVGGVLGSLFLATLVALLFLVLRIRQLKHDVVSARAASVPAQPVAVAVQGKNELPSPTPMLYAQQPVYHLSLVSAQGVGEPHVARPNELPGQY